MNFLKGLLSDDTIKELNEKLGEDLLKQVDEKLGDYKIDAGKEKLIPKIVFDTDKDKLKKQIEERDTQLKTLLKASEDNASLQAKISEMQTVNEQAKKEYEQSLLAIKRNNAYEKELAGFKPKNLKALDALINKENVKYEEKNDEIIISGLKEQIDALRKSDGYLFDGDNTDIPNPQNPPATDELSKAQDNKLRGYFGLPIKGNN